jgi:hypothetical protein
MMARMNFGQHSGIVLDACRKHGTWFDPSELRAVIDFVRAGGLEGEPNAPCDSSPKPDNESAVRAMDSALSADAIQEMRKIQGAAQIANDLLVLLFGLATRFH